MFIRFIVFLLVRTKSELFSGMSKKMRYSLSGDHEGNTEEENNGYDTFIHRSAQPVFLNVYGAQE
jgi:hypothetical protein